MENKESFEEFKRRTMSRKGIKNRVTDSWGCYDAYKKMRKNRWYNIGRPVLEREFYAIVRGVNDLLADEIAMGHTVKFPEKMGLLELRKTEHGVSLIDGKLKNTYPIDWSETLKLWWQDEEARKNKTLLRNENKWVYKITYDTHNATYENKVFYQFAVNTFIKRALCKNIKQGNVDTLW